MTIIIIAGLTSIILSILLALIALSLWLSDYLERHATYETDMTAEQIAMLSQLTERQPR